MGNKERVRNRQRQTETDRQRQTETDRTHSKVVHWKKPACGQAAHPLKNNSLHNYYSSEESEEKKIVLFFN